MSNPEIRQIVGEVYAQHLQIPPDLNPQQRQAFLDSEADRISARIAELTDSISAQSIQEWTTRTGAHPDYLTKVGMINTAKLTATEIVLNNELYELIPEPADQPTPDEEPTTAHASVGWEQRWTQVHYRSEPSEQIEDLAAHIWAAPNYSAVFRIKAAYLLATRAEEHLPLPAHHDDPLTAQLTPMVYGDLRHDRLPEH